MSIVQLNIRTRIELETRVLAAALKQSFERGDADGVSLAHRQLFLLLKDKKPGNGSGSGPASQASQSPTNGDVSVSSTSTAGTEHQPVYVPAAYAEPEIPTYTQPYQPSAEVEEVDEEDDPEQAHAIAQYLRYKQTRDQGQADPQEDQPEEVSASQSEEQVETPAQPAASSLARQATPSEEEDYVRMRKVKPHPKAELPFNQPSSEYAEIYGSAPSEPVAAIQPAPVIQLANPDFGQTSPEAPGPFDAVPEAPPQFAQRQFISSTPPTGYVPESEVMQAEHQPRQAGTVEPGSAEPGSAGILAGTEHASDQPVQDFLAAVDASSDRAQIQPPEPEFAASDQSASQHPEPEFVASDQSAIQHPEPEFAASDQSAIQHPEPEFVASDQSAIQHPEPEFVASDQSAIQHPEPEFAASDQSAIQHPEPEFAASDQSAIQHTEPEYTAADQPVAHHPESEYAASDQAAADQTDSAQTDAAGPAINRFESETVTSDQPVLHAAASAQFELEQVGAAVAEESSAQGQAPAEVHPATPHEHQHSTQDLPQIEETTQSEVQKSPQGSDYAAKYASQSSPRNMPAIDFSLQSESNKPMIDFSLESESNHPSIDFSLQSESNRPSIDFSLESESQTHASKDDALNAPTNSGFIEAEFVNSDSDSVFDEPHPQDITAELPIINPNSVLHLSEDEATEYQEDQAAAQTFEPPADRIPGAGMSLDVPMHNAPIVLTDAVTTQGVDAGRLPALPGYAPPAANPDLDTTTEEEPIPPAVPKPPDLYALLGVSQMSPFEEIHKNFLRKIRKILLKLRGSVRPERDELLKELRRNWVARDILCDPVTRTDYDFRDMGLRGSPDGQLPHAPEDGPQGRLGQRTPLRIGELLQCAGLLEMAELEIACDMHKAMPEMQFGTFLVRQGFIQERDLDSVLLGQNLLRDGKITVAQFQVAMELSQSRGANIADTLIDHGYITAAELAKLTGKSTVPESSSTPTIKEVAVKPRQQEQAPSNLSASSAVPTWKDQLDWSKPLPVDNDASLVDRNPEKQSLAELLGNVNSEVTPDSTEKDSIKISNNAAPSWKDQLDWEQPQEATAAASDHEVAQAPEDVVENNASEGLLQQQQQEEPQNSINLASAVPSWKDQLDWEQPKAESGETIPANPTEAAHADEESLDDNEYDDDEPLAHSSKETQPISIHPPTSVAPSVTLGKANLGTTPSANQEVINEEDYLQDLLKSTDIFEPEPIDTGSGSQEKDEDDETTDKSDEESEHPPEEQEGFFKKSFGKFKKPDAKDKDKKKKRK
jgi:hypothetical protein